MTNHHQASNKIDSQFYMEQLLNPENSLCITGFEPVPSYVYINVSMYIHLYIPLFFMLELLLMFN